MNLDENCRFNNYFLDIIYTLNFYLRNQFSDEYF